ncbi:LOW QUALITY PROTEIN: zf-RVT domain-containing protein, partial [Cephalotus follicularis]
RSQILHLAQFREGILPVRYLGLPLITKRLTKQDCAPLVERFMARANSWVSKSLSFAGRLLVKSSLASVQVFWSSMFLLPASVTNKCERTMRRFLWGGSGQCGKSSKVNWSQVCKPVQEGGLGIKRMRSWNEALLLKQIWNLVQQRHSWVWRHMLNLRDLARTHMVYECGRGEQFFLWYDPWFHGNSIHAWYGHWVIYDATMNGTEKLKEVIVNGRWSWPQTSWQLIEIQQRVHDISVSSQSDCIGWHKRGGAFSSKAWQLIRRASVFVPWWKLVWFSKRIPKHSFCLWLTILRAHKTKDKLLNWGLISSARCVFHCGGSESMDHLFFERPYTWDI